jgi:hypothetical protein
LYKFEAQTSSNNMPDNTHLIADFSYICFANIAECHHYVLIDEIKVDASLSSDND